MHDLYALAITVVTKWIPEISLETTKLIFKACITLL